MRKLNCAVIGLGRVGKMHLENLLTIPEINIVGVSDYFIDNLHEWLNEKGVTKNRTKNYMDLLNNSEVEAVFVFTSTNMHAEVTINAAKAGKHIFCEKPLSMDLTEDETMEALNAVKENNVKLQMGFNRRFDPQFRDVYEQVRAGNIGEPHIVKITSRDPGLLPHEFIKTSGGLLMDFTMHDFDMARYMMDSNITEVYVKGNTLLDPTLKEINDVDTLAVILQFENGGYALIDNSRQAVYGYDQRVEVFGSEGVLRAENVSESTVLYMNKEHTQQKNPLPIFTVRYTQAYINEVKFFAHSVINDEPVVCSGEDVLLAQRVAIAAQKSLESGLPVKVEQGINYKIPQIV
nr:inositol 2-dehydrogenase [uncultured Bacillus sp.]